MKNRLKVVLDTNILLVPISSKSKHHWLFEKLIGSEYNLYITNEILLEYEEIISKKYSKKVAEDVISTLIILPNVYHTTIYYKWNLISHDLDDNKFVDCVINSNSHILVTNDKHFNALNDLDFPKVNILNIDGFAEYFDKL